jgi:hypothetical protein
MKVHIYIAFIWLGAFAEAQDIKLTPEHYKHSPNSITGVYVCTPTHVKNGDCKDVDKEYYDNLARMTLGAYEIGALYVGGEKTIAFKGPLSPGSADVLIEILKNNPDVRTLTLSSQGGSEEEAYKIVEYVEAQKLRTWVPSKRMCLSACVAIFLSGSEKKLDGQLGMHSGTFYLNDQYLVRDLEAARKTIAEALYQSDIYTMKRVRMFLKLGLDLRIIDAMIAAKGDYLVFYSMAEVKAFDSNRNYLKTTAEMVEFSKAQTLDNFDFEKYVQLY